MSDERWTRIDRLVQSALGRPPHEREAFIRDACPDDDGVRDEVLSLLAHAGSADKFLEPLPKREPLPPGARLGTYEIRAQIGAGGMGEVYRAHDSRLRRDIALKILPPDAADAERLQRFEREAQAVAALNHPGIVTIHSVEQSGDLHFLTMELVDGQTLDVLIPAGGLPIDRLLALAIPLADAVGAAHGQGVVHRDLKPANVMVTRDGRVKVLDFGLAKLSRRATLQEVNDASVKTMSGRLTGERRILGTVAYMSPEQAEGRDVDHRSDVFSLGVLLFELATGRRPFKGESHVAILASIVKDVPPRVTDLKPGLPAEFARLIRKCLAKDPARRYQSVLDVRNDLEEIREDLKSPDHAGGAGRRRRPWFWLTAGLAAVLAAGVGLGVWVAPSRRIALGVAPVDGLARLKRVEVIAASRGPSRTALWFEYGIAPAGGLERRSGPGGEFPALSGRPSRTALALSPDGRFLVFVGVHNGLSHLFRLAFDRNTVELIPGTTDADVPFISPDSRRLGYWARVTPAIKKSSMPFANAAVTAGIRWMPLEGGPIEEVVRIDRPHSASWADERTVVYGVGAVEGIPGGIWRVAVGGGVPQRLTSTNRDAGETWHDFPQVLAGGHDLVLTIHFGEDLRQSKVVSYRADAKEYTVLAENATDGRIVAGGRYLLFMRGGALMGAPFDARLLKTSGREVKLIDDVMISSNTGAFETGAGQFAVSDSGHLAYLRGGMYPIEQSTLVWYDRQGNPLGLSVPPEKHSYATLRLGPDGRILTRVRQRTDQERGAMLVYDPTSNRTSRLSFDGRVQWPMWTLDGRSVVFLGTVKGRSAIFRVPADGSALAEPLTTLGDSEPAPASWLNPNELLFWQLSGVFKLAIDTKIITPVLERKDWVNPHWPSILADPPSLNSRYQFPALSPDGRWLAFTSWDSGGDQEVWVTPYPSLAGRKQVSTGGGEAPLWTRGGTEIVYIHRPTSQAVRLMAVPFVSEGSLPPAVPLFTKPGIEFGRSVPLPDFAVTPDGERFLARIRDPTRHPPPATIDVVFHWLDTLPARLGGSR